MWILVCYRLLIFASQSSNNCPVGTVLAYVGSLDTLPAGWHLCDGTNGTPDLRERFLEGSNSAGEFIKPGLPNITGKFEAGDDTPLDPKSLGAFRFLKYIGTEAGSGWQPYLQLDASLSSTIYGNSDTVQPAAYTVYFIIRLK